MKPKNVFKKWKRNKKPIRDGMQTQFRINIRRQYVTNFRLYQIENYNFDSAKQIDSIWPG